MLHRLENHSHDLFHIYTNLLILIMAPILPRTYKVEFDFRLFFVLIKLGHF